MVDICRSGTGVALAKRTSASSTCALSPLDVDTVGSRQAVWSSCTNAVDQWLRHDHGPAERRSTDADPASRGADVDFGAPPLVGDWCRPDVHVLAALGARSVPDVLPCSCPISAKRSDRSRWQCRGRPRRRATGCRARADDKAEVSRRQAVVRLGAGSGRSRWAAPLLELIPDEAPRSAPRQCVISPPRRFRRRNGDMEHGAVRQNGGVPVAAPPMRKLASKLEVSSARWRSRSC